ncbi:MAG: hypothetical protein UX16_C0013G0003 [Parcubacteria group bacterium GW2011_GWB1_45_7]|nr:MAG: hypothetical protein UX16_C0013G0003 [Parcubacteria group bacterium GW2011_GWB1_45_7]
MTFKVKYPNLTFLGISILTTVILSYFGIFDKTFGGLGKLGFLGALVAGALFPITFTSPIAVASLYYLGSHLGLPLTVAFGAIGALLGDLMIYRFLKDHTIAEIAAIHEKYRANHPTHDKLGHRKALLSLFHSKPFHSLGLFLGGLLIVLPVPDELGIAILASYRLNTRKFMVVSLVLNAVSVWIVASLGAR